MWRKGRRKCLPALTYKKFTPIPYWYFYVPLKYRPTRDNFLPLLCNHSRNTAKVYRKSLKMYSSALIQFFCVNSMDSARQKLAETLGPMIGVSGINQSISQFLGGLSSD